MNKFPHTATYWGNPQPDGYGGWSFDAPVTLDPDTGTGVRWQDRVELFVDDAGQEVRSQAVVYPQQALALNGWLLRGTSAAADPREVDGALPIRQVGKTDNLRGTKTLHKVWL